MAALHTCMAMRPSPQQPVRMSTETQVEQRMSMSAQAAETKVYEKRACTSYSTSSHNDAQPYIRRALKVVLCRCGAPTGQVTAGEIWASEQAGWLEVEAAALAVGSPAEGDERDTKCATKQAPPPPPLGWDSPPGVGVKAPAKGSFRHGLAAARLLKAIASGLG